MLKQPAKHDGPSANWFALKKTLHSTSTKRDIVHNSRKRRKLDHHGPPDKCDEDLHLDAAPLQEPCSSSSSTDIKNGESISALRKMTFGQIELSPNQRRLGKYLALDCEMVGVGLDGAESSLARVSIVNFHGAVQLDEFVKQRERVVDYRTHVSGVRESDMIKAKSFKEVQNQVAELLRGRILIGHAVSNDLKALLLSHPRSQTWDTQHCAGKYKVTPSKRVALRKLVQQELGVTIQDGEHSSVTDARATMAIYRLHRKEWEKGRKLADSSGDHGLLRKKRKREASDKDDAARSSAEAKKPVGRGWKGIANRNQPGREGKEKWWEVLGE